MVNEFGLLRSHLEVFTVRFTSLASLFDVVIGRCILSNDTRLLKRENTALCHSILIVY